MNLKPYPKYKDSGVEWLGEIPEGWEVLKLKWIAHLEYGNSLSEEAREDGTVPVYGSNGIVGKHSKSITGKPAIIIGRKGSYGKVSYSDVPCFPIDTTYYIDQSLSKENIRWLYYILSAIELDQITFDTGVPGLSRAFAYAKSVPLPPNEHQTAIANYLDQKTAKIEELIKKNEKLIELLKEKRQAIISHAVTKGLDPNAKMKDSGIEWIGEIPEEAEVLPLRRVIGKFVDYRGATPTKVDAGITLITARNIKNGKIDFAFHKEFIREEEYDSWMVRGFPEVGDVILTTEAPLGEVAEIIDTKVALAQRIILLKVKKQRIINRYLLYFFMSKAGQDILTRESTGSTALGIKASKLKAISIIVPPIKKQIEICTLLNREVSKFDRIEFKIQSQIETLKEYRQALISNVVTGKVKINEDQ